MISSIMEAAKIESGASVLEKYPVDLLNLLDELKRTYDMPFDKELVLIWDWSPGLPSITTDGAKLKMILQNLVNNAIKFTDQGSVTVSARVVENKEQTAKGLRIEDGGSRIAEIQNPKSKIRRARSKEQRAKSVTLCTSSSLPCPIPASASRKWTSP